MYALASSRLRQISVASVLKWNLPQPAEITRHVNVPLRGSLPSSQLSCSGIPPDTMLVGPEEGICPRQASVLTAICPGARRHPSQIWITKETCLSHWQIGDHAIWPLLPGSVRVCLAGAALSSACYCLTGTWLLERPFPWTSDRGHAILPPEDSSNWPGTGPPRHPVSFP